MKQSNRDLKPHKWLKKYIKIIFKWARYLILILKYGKKCQKWIKNDLYNPKKARIIDKKSKFCFKLPRIDMEMSRLGKKDHVRFPQDFGLNRNMNFYDYFPFS